MQQRSRLNFASSALWALCALACSSIKPSTREQISPGVTIPVHVAEGEPQPGNEPKAAEPLAAAPAGSLPDPEPLQTEQQWEYELLYQAGEVKVLHVRRVLFKAPVVTARRMGRFAAELWIGKELVERVRFDFPLLAADVPITSKRRPLHEPPVFEAGAKSSHKVLVPNSDRATQAVLVDRATGKILPLAWPPHEY